MELHLRVEVLGFSVVAASVLAGAQDGDGHIREEVISIRLAATVNLVGAEPWC